MTNGEWVWKRSMAYAQELARTSPTDIQDSADFVKVVLIGNVLHAWTVWSKFRGNRDPSGFLKAVHTVVFASGSTRG